MVFAVAQKERDQMPFRLAPDQMRRLDRAARERGQSRQAFVEGCVLAELSEHEERRHAKRNPEAARSPLRREESDHASGPIGLGIGETLRKRREVSEDEVATPAAAQAPIVVNVGGNAPGAGSPHSDIDRLAAFVTNGSDFDRDTRLRTAVAVLAASTSTAEERKVLAARLDEAIAAKTKTSGSDDGSGVKRIARIAFDKLSDFWEGKS